MQIARMLFVGLAAASLGGCGASLPKLSTGSLFGAKTETPIDRDNDPATRTMDVAATSARAIKCGYNFDPAKLKTSFLTTQSAGNPADLPKLTQIYDASFNTVSKALVDKPDYCTSEKTAKIKLALNRHLAGDYTPSPPEPVEDDSLFGGWGQPSPDGHGANMQQMMQ
ncbi:hypothetical protein HYPDE_30063 [Hyphomicrobium denitrificans 1NES1]|uniref:Lipoprotein n=1 Tax=Hyphomicrobium denitrificans 1NES1 TaxID=670307 RepID=N0B611_9HYPH|nr:hypothetical protein [Hyphomicrobium denitrificans]AGK57687.1 hypothetical protein HYPDE_30063 [Hyphomicrobium denitrificans 1NES1]